MIVESLVGIAAGGDLAVVGTDPAPVISTPLRSPFGFSLRASPDNADTVYVGGPGTSVSTGFPLAPNEAIVIPVTDLSSVVAVSGTDAQGLRYSPNVVPYAVAVRYGAHTVTPVDSVAVGGQYGRSPADAPAVNESAEVSGQYQRAPADAPTVSDSATAVKA